jgi:outer membrane lipoprotein carrier protein
MRFPLSSGFFRSLLLLMLLPSLSWAGNGAQYLQRFLENLETLQARFEQSILDKTHSRAERFQGIFSLKRPGQFRWDYHEPYEQQIVADGNRIWVYDSDLEQVSNRSQEDALRGTPAQLLSDTAPLETNFEVIDIGESQGMNWVELIPRDEESQFIRILLAFYDKELRRMEMADQFGQVTRFQFYDIRRNPELDDNLFVFVPPKEFDILEQ